MRNLKRALSLTLASVMLLGMMVVGSSAAGFPDVDDTKNVEAIEVLQAVAVMVGDKDTGNFRPDAPVSRAEMAVIMSNLLGLTTSYYVSTCPFEDVSGSYSWARGPVGAAYASKVLSGRTATTFDPAATVTAVEAASMIMRGLGYFQHTGDFADGFNVATVRQANLIGLFSGIKGDATTPLTRNQVAQMALNALQANIVDFTGTPGIKFDGVEVGYKAEYTPRTSPDGKYAAIGKLVSNIGTTDQYYVQLGEELYDGDLRLDDTTDAFGAPARRWSYESEEIGTYAKNELLHKEYSEKVTGRDLYDLLGANVIKEWDIYVAIDGETSPTVNGLMFDKSDMTRNNNEGVGGTDKGVLTQVYMDTTNKEVYIVVINTYLAIATEDYDSKNEDVQLDVYALNKSSAFASKAPDYIKDRDNEKISVTVENEDIDVSGVKDGDKFLVTVADGNVQTMVAPEIMDSVSIESFKVKTNVTVDGENYDYAHTAKYDVEVLDEYSKTNLKDTTYNIMLDKYGYLIGIEQNQDPDQYVFLTGMNGNSSDLATKNADANVIFMDGTMKTVSINVSKSDLPASGPQMNTWCTYSVTSGDVYTLTQVNTDGTGDPKVMQSAQDADDETDPADQIKIDTKNVSLKAITGNAYGNDDTVYLAVSTDVIKAATDGGTDQFYHYIINDVESRTVGTRNTSLVADEQTGSGDGDDENDGIGIENEVFTLYNEKGYVIAAVVIGEEEGMNKTFAYVHSDGVKRERYNKDKDEWTWVREAIVDGKIVDLTEIGGGEDLSVLEDMDQGAWFELRLDADGNVKRTEPKGSPSDWAVELTFAAFNASTNPDKINVLDDVDKAVNAKDTVLLQVEDLDGELSYKSGTLYTSKDDTEGFSVSPNVNVVLCDSDFDADDSYSGRSGLERAIKNLNDNFQGDLNVVFDKGDAVVIILVDKSEAEDDGDDGDSNNELTWLDKSDPTAPTFYMGDSVAYTPTDDDIYAMLKAEGYTDIKLTPDGWSFSKGFKSWVDATITPVQQYKVTYSNAKVTVDGVDFQIISADKDYATKNTAVTLTIAAKGTVVAGSKVANIEVDVADNVADSYTDAVAGTAGAPTAGATKADGTGTAVTTGLTPAAGKFTTGTAADAPDARYTVTITIDNTKPADTAVSIEAAP